MYVKGTELSAEELDGVSCRVLGKLNLHSGHIQRKLSQIFRD